jgi:VanZ family protein
LGRRRLYFRMLVGWVALTLTLTSIPNLQTPVDLPHADKLAHLGFYGVMGFLFALWRREASDPVPRAILVAILFIVVLGALDEGHQSFIPGRSMEFNDWLADMAGGGIGSFSSGFIPSVFPFLVTKRL